MYETFNSQGPSARTSGLNTHDPRGGIINALGLRFRNLLRRRKIARLEALDDSLLADIGLERSDLIWARHLDLSQNPLKALDQAARQRSSEYRLALARKAVR